MRLPRPPRASRASRSAPGSPGLAGEHDALVAALTLSPATYSRNRFFELYRDAGAVHARRRASLLRALIADLLRAVQGKFDLDVSLRPAETLPGAHVLEYGLPSLGYRREVTLEPTELALVRAAIAKRALGEAVPPALAARPEDLRAIESALARLAPEPPRRRPEEPPA